MKKTGPYIGVTGFMSRDEVLKALEVVPKKSTHRLMAGVLMSSKTLDGLTNKYPGRYPQRDQIADILVDDPRALNLVHYNTDKPETLFRQLTKISKLAGPNLDGFQLNIAWPSICQVEDWWENNPDKFLVLQIGRQAMKQVASLEHFQNLLGAYVPMVDAILIDASMGEGRPLIVEDCRKYLQAASIYSTLGLGAAGGLGQETLHSFGVLFSEFPGLSPDAQNCLRTPPPEDALHISAMQGYLKKAFSIVAKH